MRIWSLHPKYLDAKGLVALWRETLLAKNVLLNKTRGYKNHPQLNRFKKLKNPVDAIDQYLREVLKEAVSRGYKFNSDKISKPIRKIKMNVTSGQITYESAHLLKKLKLRDKKKYSQLKSLKHFEQHSVFRVVKGEIESWEAI
ncbi:MAG: pyrimidine dimer DNA glycosylase/endonuclease V [Bacteroidota bacterium]